MIWIPILFSAWPGQLSTSQTGRQAKPAGQTIPKRSCTGHQVRCLWSSTKIRSNYNCPANGQWNHGRTVWRKSCLKYHRRHGGKPPDRSRFRIRFELSPKGKWIVVSCKDKNDTSGGKRCVFSSTEAFNVGKSGIKHLLAINTEWVTEVIPPAEWFMKHSG